ncbi:MAG: hypothetical protein ACEQSF_00640, partial [Solirubrobacteraceae bacterium]
MIKKIYLLLFLLVLLFNSCKIDDELVTKNPNLPPIKEQSGVEDEFLNFFYRNGNTLHVNLAHVGMDGELGDAENIIVFPIATEGLPVASVPGTDAVSIRPNYTEEGTTRKYTGKCTIRLARGTALLDSRVSRRVYFKVKLIYWSDRNNGAVDPPVSYDNRSVEINIPEGEAYKDVKTSIITSTIDFDRIAIK